MAVRGVRRRGAGPDRADPNLIPLLDIVLQLITFFMMLVHFGTRLEGATVLVRLPVAPTALPTIDLGIDRMSVVLDASGRLHEGESHYGPDERDAFWQSAAATRRAGLKVLGLGTAGELPTVVVLRADAAVPYGAVRELLVAAQAVGFGRFTLLVEREDEP